MDQETVTKVVHDVLKHIQSGLGHDCPPLVASTTPLRDLKGFDSPMSIAATGRIARRLGVTIPHKKNIFGDKTGKYSISKTVEYLCGLTANIKKIEAA